MLLHVIPIGAQPCICSVCDKAVGILGIVRTLTLATVVGYIPVGWLLLRVKRIWICTESLLRDFPLGGIPNSQAWLDHPDMAAEKHLAESLNSNFISFAASYTPTCTRYGTAPPRALRNTVQKHPSSLLTSPDGRSRNRVRRRWGLEVQVERDAGVGVPVASDEVEFLRRHGRPAAGDGDLRARGVDLDGLVWVGWVLWRRGGTHIGRRGCCSWCRRRRPRGVLQVVVRRGFYTGGDYGLPMISALMM